MDTYQGISFRVAYVAAGDAADAEDAVADGFSKAWLALPRFRPGAPFRPWLLEIVANEARNRRRSSGRRARLALRSAAQLRPGTRPHPPRRPSSTRRGGSGPCGRERAARGGAPRRRVPLLPRPVGGRDGRRARTPPRHGEVAAGAGPGARLRTSLEEERGGAGVMIDVERALGAWSSSSHPRRTWRPRCACRSGRRSAASGGRWRWRSPWRHSRSRSRWPSHPPGRRCCACSASTARPSSGSRATLRATPRRAARSAARSRSTRRRSARVHRARPAGRRLGRPLRRALPPAARSRSAATTGRLWLTELLGQGTPYVEKSIGQGTRVTYTDVNGNPGYWLEGDRHLVIFRDGGGRVIDSRAAGNVLLWEDGRSCSVSRAHGRAQRRCGSREPLRREPV